MGILDRFLGRDAATDPAVFAALVLRDEETGGPVTLAPHHKEMHRNWTTYDRDVMQSCTESGKTQNLVARVAWEIARDPTLRVSYVCGALGQSTKACAAIARILESEACRAIFPKVRPGTPWSAEHGYVLANRPRHLKDANLEASALGLGSTLGGRFRLIVGDDLLDPETTQTQTGRDKAFRDWTNVHVSRLAPTGGRIWLANTVWNRDDILHRAAALDGWHSKAYPILDKDGVSIWPEKWTPDAIEKKRRDLGPRSFNRNMLCIPTDDSACLFSASDIEAARVRGINDSSYSTKPVGRYVIGVDPSFSTGPKSDLTAYVVVCETDINHRLVVECNAGHWSQDQTTAMVVDRAHHYRATVAVESNAGGKFVAEQIAKHVPTTTYPTTRESKLAMVDAFGAELNTGRWTFMSTAPYTRKPGENPHTEQMRSLISELLIFTLDEHAGDRAMGLLIALHHLRSLPRRRRADDSVRLSNYLDQLRQRRGLG